MTTILTVTVVITLIIAMTLFHALHRQTKRADIAEAALERFETVIQHQHALKAMKP